MVFWLAMLLLCATAVAGISVPLLRRNEQPRAQSAQTAVYEDQISEVDRDLVSGNINAPEASAAKAELHRRLEAAAKPSAPPRLVSEGWRKIVLGACIGLVAIGGAGIYAELGTPALNSMGAGDLAKVQGNQAAVAEAVSKLKDTLKANPTDVQAWQMLGWISLNMQRWPEAVDAYQKAESLDPANLEIKSALLEAMVQAGQGIVTPQARSVISELLQQQPKDPRGLFYDAIAHEQAADQTGALDRWLALLADTPADAPWRQTVILRATVLAKTLGKDISAQVSATPAPVATTPAIAGMIAKLQGELAANPQNKDGWAMLIRSLTVTGDAKGADAALAQSMDIFKDDKVTQDALRRAADEARQKSVK